MVVVGCEWMGDERESFCCPALHCCFPVLCPDYWVVLDLRCVDRAFSVSIEEVRRYYVK